MTQSNSARIIHSVIFILKHEHGSPGEHAFFSAAKELSSIPGVEKFQCLKQTSGKNKFKFGLSMEFANQELYDAYSIHQQYQAFIEKVWLKDVEDFMEIDYTPMN